MNRHEWCDLGDVIASNEQYTAQIASFVQVEQFQIERKIRMRILVQANKRRAYWHVQLYQKIKESIMWWLY